MGKLYYKDLMEISFSLDLEFFLRIFGAFLWGAAWATFLQFHRQGQFLVQERTWLTVVIGVGLDMAIAYPLGWWMILAVLAASSLPIIFRSLYNEQNQPVEFRRNKVLWNIADALALLADMDKAIERLLNTPDLPAPAVRRVQEVLSLAGRIRRKLFDANNGEYGA